MLTYTTNNRYKHSCQWLCKNQDLNLKKKKNSTKRQQTTFKSKCPVLQLVPPLKFYGNNRHVTNLWLKTTTWTTPNTNYSWAFELYYSFQNKYRILSAFHLWLTTRHNLHTTIQNYCFSQTTTNFQLLNVNCLQKRVPTHTINSWLQITTYKKNTKKEREIRLTTNRFCINDKNKTT